MPRPRTDQREPTDAALETPADLRSTLVRSAAWVAADKWGSRVIQLVTFGILGRLLGPTAFGLVALASVVIVVTQLLVDQGFSKALIQRQDLEPEHCDAAFWTAIGGSCLIAAVLALIAGPLSTLLGEPDLAPIMRWLALALPLGAVQSTPAALMERQFQYQGLAVRHLIGAVIGGAAGIAAALAGAGVWSLVTQTLVGAGASSLVLWRVSHWRPRMRFSSSHFRDLWRFGVNVLGIEIIGLVNQQSDRLIVGAALGPKALGYYFVGFRILSVAVDTMSAVIAQVALPGFSRLQRQPERLRQAFYTATRTSVTVSIPVFVGLAALSPVLIPVLFGPGWEKSVPVMQALAGLGIMNAAAYFDRSALLAVDQPGLAFRITFVQAAINVIAVLITVRYGIVFVAIGVTIRQYLVWPLRIWALRRSIGLEVFTYLRPWVLAVVASAVMLGCMLAAMSVLAGTPPGVTIAVASVIGLITYSAALRVVAPGTIRELVATVRPAAPAAS